MTTDPLVEFPADPVVPDATPRASALNSEYPSGWWIVALSDDVSKGRVIPLEALEKHLVLWRGFDGILHCQAAHCLHLGSHLGYGGVVKESNTIQCPFHGWSYDPNGTVAGQLGPPRSVNNLCLPTYQILERDGAVYLWNGGIEPDHVIPDLYSHYGVSSDEYFTVPHRFYMPFRAKYFVENACDAMHLAVAHGAAEWGEGIALEETQSMIRFEHRLHNLRPWYTWDNLKRLYRQGELINFFTPVRGSVVVTSFGASIHLTHIEKTGKWGNHLLCWTPIDEATHHQFIIDVVPRPRVPVGEPVLRKLLTFILRVGLYSTAAQDFAIMKHRVEGVKPPYARFDKGLIAFRRHWDSRIQSERQLDGDDVHSNGLRAGIRSRKLRGDVE